METLHSIAWPQKLSQVNRKQIEESSVSLESRIPMEKIRDEASKSGNSRDKLNFANRKWLERLEHFYRLFFVFIHSRPLVRSPFAKTTIPSFFIRNPRHVISHSTFSQSNTHSRTQRVREILFFRTNLFVYKKVEPLDSHFFICFFFSLDYIASLCLFLSWNVHGQRYRVSESINVSEFSTRKQIASASTFFFTKNVSVRIFN